MRRFETRESRFSNRVLMTWAASSLPQTLAFRAEAAGAAAEILLYDEIGYWGVTASDFAAALSRAGDGPLTLRINSPGGDVFDGYAIYNMLRARTSPVSVVIDGLAASAASFIAMAGTTVTMGEPSMLMIHNSWGMCIGDRNDMLDMAATQEKIDGQIAAIYAAKCGKPAADVATMMNDETWLTSTDALEQKFCDAVLGAAPDASALANTHKPVPIAPRAKLRAAVQPYDPDGDGDNDAQQAIDQINDAMGLLGRAVASLTGAETDGASDRASAEIAAKKKADDEAAAKLAADRAAEDWLINADRRLRLAEAEAA